MFNFLALITNNHYWKLHSLVIKAILSVYGIRIGRNFYCAGVPRLKIRGKASNIVIGNNVQFLGNVDLRNRENGKILFDDNVTLEGDVRIVSARDGTIQIGEDSILCAYTIINGGEDVLIGKKCIVAPRCSINANEHVFIKDIAVRDSGFVHEPVTIGDDCWIAVNCVVMKGVSLAKGTVIGSGSVVTKNTEPYSLYAGAPARKIGERK